MKRTLAAAMTVALVVLGSFTVVGPTSAAVTALTGTITVAQPVALSGDAVAVVTLVDQTTGPDAGGVIGEQRIDGVASVPVAFEVPYDDSGIDSKHSYAIVASIVDGAKEYNSQEPVPVITGGPSVNVEAPVVEAPALPTAITGAIAVPAGAALSAEAVATAVLVKKETGTLVATDTIPSVAGASSIDFSLGFEADLVDPAATYVVLATVVDQTRKWGTDAGVDAIVGGAPAASPLTVPVVERPEGIPGPSPEPTPTVEPTPTEAPTPTIAPVRRRPRRRRQLPPRRPRRRQPPSRRQRPPRPRPRRPRPPQSRPRRRLPPRPRRPRPRPPRRQRRRPPRRRRPARSRRPRRRRPRAR
jgi:uncharacterized lipoprotein YbaY